MISAAVIDIEGTVAATDHVHRVLFPYSRERIGDWLAEHRDTAVVAEVLAQTRDLAGRPDAGETEVAEILRRWIDEDVKAAPLKTAQGEIWRAGYASGELVSHLYPDVPGALRSWVDGGLAVYVYSSGSVEAQRGWFAHTPYGDLTGLLSGHFDLTNAGGKREASSYRRIAEAVGLPGERLVFLSDIPAELDAAAEAGWHTIGVRRPEERFQDLGRHRVVESLHGFDPRR
ncbi:acireductone synthase [Gandjariella thermophila]|uniref:Enolase-phosphatase E1 n=1 Tax=Gandjariella thermophila TaxID=1931992 RepID=A0A4D4J1N5_9PSEU|nr:acireductone synthase [Gandjariella thermophila]GDY29070.1 enolase-phosphatase E1 [Gandjariella thermophila]